MELDKIITLTNAPVRLHFLAMERSLRKIGCDLPVWVIPYDESQFELPINCRWWEEKEVINWLNGAVPHRHPRHVMRKYQCLTSGGYQFVDSDVIFLHDPREALQSVSGFVTSCCHWHNPGHTVTPDSVQCFLKRTTTWQKAIFNTGQFACDRVLYSLDELRQTAEQESFRGTCLDSLFHEQMGINLLVHASGVPVTNLTLPPFEMESTWAGDYPDKYEKYWSSNSRKPYLIHWAGTKLHESRPIDRLFFEFLSSEEKKEYKLLSENRGNDSATGNLVGGLARKSKAALKAFLEA